MKKLRTVFAMALVAVICITVAGCGAKEKNINGSLKDLMDKVYVNVPEDERPMMLENIEVTKENVKNYLGTDKIEFEEALASESMVGAIAHSVVLVRAKDGADIEKMKKDIKENVDPRKWICVGVEEENVIVKNKGNLIILIMSNDYAEKIESGFDSLK